MNNNRINNRRRGRGSNRQQGGGQPLNRIDSRARGNAPQLLEKFRKLAQDAHMNGDRVSAEYYFQFADHYFRVIADSRQRQEEQRRPRDERFPDQSFEDGDEGEFGAEGEFGGFDQSNAQPFRRDEQRSEPRSDQRNEPRSDQRSEPRSDQRNEPRFPRREERRDEPRPEPEAVVAPPPPSETAEPAVANPFEPAGGNPFTRDNRAIRGLRPRREFRGESAETAPPIQGEAPGEPDAIDSAVLPPAISEARDAGASVPAEAEETPPPRKRGRPRRRPAEEPDGDAVEVVSG